jgi:hypothetical protein
MNHALSGILRITLSLLGVTVFSQPSIAEGYGQKFQGRNLDARLFRSTGSNAHRAITTSQSGLRIFLRADHGNDLPVGFVARSGVRGDFEITLAYTINNVPKPSAGKGAGVSIWISTSSATRDSATLARMVRPDGQIVYVAHRAFTPPRGQREHQAESSPAEGTSGKLKLIRKGSELTYQYATANSNTFRDLHRTEFTNDDLDTLRFAADNGGSPSVVDVRIDSVTIQADQVGGAIAAIEPSGTPTWVWVGALLLVSVGVYWHRRRAQSDEQG